MKMQQKVVNFGLSVMEQNLGMLFQLKKEISQSLRDFNKCS